jgi:hypothetical protein
VVNFDVELITELIEVVEITEVEAKNKEIK